MAITPSNTKIIPPDYSCGLIFREFKKTMMHEQICCLRRDRMFFGNEDGGTSRRYYDRSLDFYLRLGWPEADQGARWNHNERLVKIFADDLFLCPNCGTFQLVVLWPEPLPKLGLQIEGEMIKDWPSQILVTDECAQQIRFFCQSRLETKEFFFKECDDERVCGEVRQIAMRRIQGDNGRKKNKEGKEFFPPLPEIEKEKKEKKVEVLPWDEGYIYLIHMSGHYKIGIAKDTQKRISGIKTSSPFEIEILKSWRCKRPDLIEKIMHARFGEHRVRGEWFRLPDEALKYLLAVEDVRKEFAPDQSEGDTD